MKKMCKDCKSRFDVPVDDLEDGDAFDCPECGLEYTIVYEGITLTLIESKTLEMDNEEFELDKDEDYE
jgi:DNA-directed RNA polymerase subunit RPC12/RpoP